MWCTLTKIFFSSTKNIKHIQERVRAAGRSYLLKATKTELLNKQTHCVIENVSIVIFEKSFWFHVQYNEHLIHMEVGGLRTGFYKFG